MSQAELIKRAFAGDDVQADFEAAKAAEVEEELPKQVTVIGCMQKIKDNPSRLNYELVHYCVTLVHVLGKQGGLGRVTG